MHENTKACCRKLGKCMAGFFLELCAESQNVTTQRPALVSIYGCFFLQLFAELQYMETHESMLSQPYKCIVVVSNHWIGLWTGLLLWADGWITALNLFILHDFCPIKCCKFGYCN